MKLRSKVATTLTATFAVLGLTLASASAFNHTETEVGGDKTQVAIPVVGSNDGKIKFMTDWGVPAECINSSIEGEFYPGKPVVVGSPTPPPLPYDPYEPPVPPNPPNPGSPGTIDDGVVGSIEDFTLTNCTVNSMPVTITMAPNANTKFIVREHPANAGDPVKVWIADIDANITDTAGNCNFDADGRLKATIYPASSGNNGVVVIEPDLDLNISVGGTGMTCATQIQDGDKAEMEGTFEMDTLGKGDIDHS